MLVTNTGKSPLRFVSGQKLAVGQSLEIEDLDLKHPVHAAWVEAKLFSVDSEAPKGKTKTNKE